MAKKDEDEHDLTTIDDWEKPGTQRREEERGHNVSVAEVRSHLTMLLRDLLLWSVLSLHPSVCVRLYIEVYLHM